MPRRHSQSFSLVFALSIWLLLLCSTPAFCDEYEYAVDAEGGTAHLSNADNNNDAISAPVSPPDILDDDDEDEYEDEDEDEDENYYENRDEDDEEIRDYYGDEEEGYEYDEEYASDADYYGEEEYDEDQEHEEWEDEGDYYYDENENEGEEYKSKNDLYMTSEEYADLLKTKHKDFDWKIHGSTSDLWYNLGCEEIFQSPRPLHSQSDWVNARNIYKSIVEDESTLPNDNDGDDNDNDNDNDAGNSHSGFEVKVVAKQSPGKGRGIYAVEDIKEGDLIYSSKQTARFSSGAHYREFLLALEPHFACDVLQWAFVTELGANVDDKVNGNVNGKEELQLKISVDLDEGCFCNNGWGPTGEEEGPNLGCNQDHEEGEEFPPSCKTNFHALRDIKAGEEFLCSYGDFVIGDGWHEFGLGATW